MKGFCWVGSSQWTVWIQVAGFRSDEAVLNVSFLRGGVQTGDWPPRSLSPLWLWCPRSGCRLTFRAAGIVLWLLRDYSCAFASLFISLTALMPGFVGWPLLPELQLHTRLP